MYLNAAVYRDVYGTPSFKADEMDKVTEYCDKIINSGQYKLAADYFSIFNSDNHSNPELVFAVDQRAELNGHNRMAYFSLSGDQFPLPAYPNANGTDGPAITPDFYRTWVNEYAPKDPAGADPGRIRANPLGTGHALRWVWCQSGGDRTHPGARPLGRTAASGRADWPA